MGLGIPRESDFEAQWDLITGFPQDWLKQRLHSWRAQTNLVHAKNQRKGAVIPQETEQDLPASVGVSSVGMWVGRGSPQEWGHRQQQSVKASLGVNPLGNHHQPYHIAQDWVASGQKTTREGGQPHSSADNWIKALLSKAMLTKTRPSFSHPDSPIRKVHKPFSLIHQKADKRRKKRHSLTVAKIKTALQKGNHDEKAESCVPDEGTR